MRTALVVTATILLAAVFLGWEFYLHRPYTPAIESGEAAVASLEEIDLQGVKQTILIRGQDRAKPILLFLHGGPGMPMMFLAHEFQRDMERDFLIVHWDRRGAGKSFDAGIDYKPTVRETLDDLYALTEYLDQRFDPVRFYLVGHSWGSYLGMLAAHERPELFTAYIGTGQMAAGSEDIDAQRRTFFQQEAKAREDTEMLKRLDSGDEITEDDLFQYGAELRGATSFWPILKIGLRAPEYQLNDILNVPKGSQRLNREMDYDVISGSLEAELTKFQIPIFFLLGRHDWNEPSTLAALYLEEIEAPQKAVYWFEDSAHFPFLEQTDKFYEILLKIDRRMAHTSR